MSDQEKTANQQISEQSDSGVSSREAARLRIRQQQKAMIVRKEEGEYQFDNPELEYKTKRQKKLAEFEDKYKDKPKIAFHELTDEGDKAFMQAKRDRVWTTIGWSAIGNVVGIGLVRYFDANPLQRWRANQHLGKREAFKVTVFLGTVAFFTLYGFGNARQQFVKSKQRKYCSYYCV